jgi:hypothetical protein
MRDAHSGVTRPMDKLENTQAACGEYSKLVRLTDQPV